MPSLFGGSEEQNHYEILGVKRDATKTDIEKAFKKLALTTHPDKNPAQDATAKFQRVNTAYTALKDPTSRRTYDFELRTSSTKARRQQTRHSWAPSSATAQAWAKEAERAKKERKERESWASSMKRMKDNAIKEAADKFAAARKKVKEEIKAKAAVLNKADRAAAKQKREEEIKRKREEEMEAGRDTFTERVEQWKVYTRAEYVFLLNEYSGYADPLRVIIAELKRKLEVRRNAWLEIRANIEKERTIIDRNMPNVMIITTTEKQISDCNIVRSEADAKLQKLLKRVGEVNLLVRSATKAIKRHERQLADLDEQYYRNKNTCRMTQAKQAVELLEAAIFLFYQEKTIPAKMERCLDLWKEVSTIDILARESSSQLKLVQKQVVEKYDEWMKGDGSGSLFEFNFR